MSGADEDKSARRRQLLARAQAMRSGPTPAEAILWRHLRRRQLLGLRFRRQQPYGPFILDFYCRKVSLAIELDGESHAKKRDQDRVKALWLEGEGLSVIRFKDRQVKKNLESVLQVIYDHCQSVLQRSESGAAGADM